MIFTVKAGEKGPALTAIPKAYVEQVIAFFEENPDKQECRAGLPGGAVMVVKRDDLPKLKAAIPIGKLNEVDIDGQGNFKAKESKDEAGAGSSGG